jgi:hypothetical protein
MRARAVVIALRFAGQRAARRGGGGEGGRAGVDPRG